MANTEVGSAYVSIIPSMKGFDKAVSSGIKSAFGSVAKIAAGAMAGISFASFVKDAASAFGDFQQYVGGVQTMFVNASADASQTVINNAKNAYATMGISANDYLDNVMKFSASLKQSLGGDVVQAAEYANTAMQDMSDNASIFGTNIADIQNAYQGFAKQNYTMLDNLRLGYGGTKSEMERLIADANEYEKAQGRAGDLTIDSFADIVQAIHDVQEAQGIAGNQAKEINHTLQGSLMEVQATWQNWLTALGSGEDVSKATQQLATAISTFAGNLVPVIAQVISSLIAAVPQFISEFSDAISASMPEMVDAIAQSFTDSWNTFAASTGLDLPQINVEDVKSSLNTIGENFTGFFENFKSGFDSVADTEGFRTQIEDLGVTLQTLASAGGSVASILSNGVAPALGAIAGGAIQAVVGFVNGLVSGFNAIASSPLFQGLLEQLGAAFQSLGEALQPVVEAMRPIGEIIGTIAGLIATVLIVALIQIIQWITNIVTVVTTVVGTITAVVTGIVTFIGGIPGQIVGFFTGIGERISAFFGSGADLIRGIFSGIVANAASIPGRIVGFFSHIGNDIGCFFNEAKSTVSDVFDGIVDFVRGIPDKIVDFFSGIGERITDAIGSINFPTPHVSWEDIQVGNLSVGLPHVEWYGAGGIVNGATLIGAGERGSEFIWPSYEPYMSRYANAISEHIDAGRYDGMIFEELRDIRRDLNSLDMRVSGEDLTIAVASGVSRTARMYGV